MVDKTLLERNNGVIEEQTASEIMGELSQVGDSDDTVGGLLSRKFTFKVSPALNSSPISLFNIPIGAKILGVSLRVKTLIASDTGATWGAVYSGGIAAQAIGSGLSFAKNTKVNKLFDANANSPIVASSVGTVTITLNTGAFTAGVVEGVVYYEELTALADAA